MKRNETKIKKGEWKMIRNKLKIMILCIFGLLIATSITAVAYSINMPPSPQIDSSEDFKEIPRDAEWYFKPDSYAELVLSLIHI